MQDAAQRRACLSLPRGLWPGVRLSKRPGKDRFCRFFPNWPHNIILTIRHAIWIARSAVITRSYTESDGYEPSVTTSPPDRQHKNRIPGTSYGGKLSKDRLHLRPCCRETAKRRALHPKTPSPARRGPEARPHDDTHAISLPDPQVLDHGQRAARSRSLECVHPRRS